MTLSHPNSCRSLGLASAVLAVPLLLPAPAVQAQGQAPASTDSAAKFGGGRAAGDPRGAVRALGSVQGADSKPHDAGVKVPEMGGEQPNQTRGVPLGTTR